MKHIYILNKRSREIHRVVEEAGHTLSQEQCNLDQAEDTEEGDLDWALGQLAGGADRCGHCFATDETMIKSAQS